MAGKYKSQCRTRDYKNFRGKYTDKFVEGWYYSKPTGFIKAAAFETKNSTVNEKGRVNVMLQIINLTTKSKSSFLAFMDRDNYTVVSQEAGFVMSPRRGYCGPQGRKERRK